LISACCSSSIEPELSITKRKSTFLQPGSPPPSAVPSSPVVGGGRSGRGSSVVSVSSSLSPSPSPVVGKPLLALELEGVAVSWSPSPPQAEAEHNARQSEALHA